MHIAQKNVILGGKFMVIAHSRPGVSYIAILRHYLVCEFKCSFV